MSLYAQHGYGKANKIEKAINCGDISGVVLSPKSEPIGKIKDYISTLQTNHSQVEVYFDPQFYICNMQGEVNAGKLIDYPYYENGLTRAQLSIPSNIHKYAKNVIDFQQILGLSNYLSPTISFDNFNGRESQTVLSLAYESIELTTPSEKLMVSLCIHESAFKNRDELEDFLNIISLFDVKGFYIIIERTSNMDRANVISSDILANIMYMIYILSEINGFETIIGYSDLISIPLAAAGNSNFACGWYNNLKMFSEGNFRPSSGGRRPRKRYTSRVLMNSILLVPELSTLNRQNVTPQIVSKSSFDSIVYPTINDTEWTDEISCLHNWHTLNSILSEIDQQGTISNKIAYVIERIKIASENYDIVNKYLPTLDSKSNNNHLGVWFDAINEFKKTTGV